MNLKKALEILKNIGHKFEKINGKYYQLGFRNEKYELSERQIINWAREYTSEGQRTNIKKKLKWTEKRKNRAKTREDIHHENFDNFSSNKLRVKEDIWNFD